MLAGWEAHRGNWKFVLSWRTVMLLGLCALEIVQQLPEMCISILTTVIISSLLIFYLSSSGFVKPDSKIPVVGRLT